MKYVFLALIPTLVACSGPSATAPPPPSPKPLFVAYGDSISYGSDLPSRFGAWPYLAAPAEGWALDNESVPGRDLVTGGVNDLQTKVIDKHPAYVAIMLGTDDSVDLVDPAVYLLAYNSILQTIHAKLPFTVVYVVEPPQLCPAFNDRLPLFIAAMQEAAAANNVKFISTAGLLSFPQDYDSCAHPNYGGHQKLSAAIVGEL